MASSTPSLQGFSLDLLKSLSCGTNNVFFSPHSVASALMLVCLGARDDTLDQIVTTLGIGQDNLNVHETFDAICNRVLAATKDGVEINIANKLYARKGLELVESFVEDLKKYYEGGVESVDFASDSDGCREMINKWVEQQTNKKIKDLLQSGMITPGTEMVVVNAIYFKGFWEKPFNQENTKEDYFNVSSDEKVKVPMMKATLQLQYMIDDDLSIKAVALPYQGRKLSMVILLPDRIGGLDKVADSLTRSKIQDVFSNLLDGRKYGVELRLPRFKMVVTSEVEMALQNLGITDIFSEKINLTGMLKYKSRPITDVIHKAFIEVNEQGTEAAAATAMLSRCMLLPTGNEIFRCDRPFMFFIVESSLKSILFIGKFYRPE